MANQNFLICLVGLPASGKSNFANKLKIALKKKFENLNIMIIDPDLIRYNLIPEKFDHEKEQIIRKENLKIIRNELKKGNIVISDDLNYYTSMRHELKDIAENLNLFLFIIHIATPIEICLKWNEKRGLPIPNTVIYKINKRFDKFNKYKWDIPDVVYDLSQVTDFNQILNETLTKIQEKRELTKSKSKIVEMNNNASNINNESLDRITRLYVSKLLLDSAYMPFKKRIIKLRKDYVKKNKNKALRESEILKRFKKFLEKHLSLKIPEKF
ncbi:MAG: AAA family ATPase [Candidatus Odinarchaeota archaeon]